MKKSKGWAETMIIILLFRVLQEGMKTEDVAKASYVLTMSIVLFLEEAKLEKSSSGSNFSATIKYYEFAVRVSMQVGALRIVFGQRDSLVGAICSFMPSQIAVTDVGTNNSIKSIVDRGDDVTDIKDMNATTSKLP